MHIHMERGRVSSVRRIENSTRIHPHRPMSSSVFSKAIKIKKCHMIKLTFYFALKNTNKEGH